MISLDQKVYLIFAKTVEYLCKFKLHHNVYTIQKVKAVSLDSGLRDKKVSDQLKSVIPGKCGLIISVDRGKWISLLVYNRSDPESLGQKSKAFQ